MVDAIRRLLVGIPSLTTGSVEHKYQIWRGDYIDGRMDLSHGGTRYALLVEVRADAAPRYVRAAVYQLKGYVAHLQDSGRAEAGPRWIPMLASSYLSPQSRAICRDHGVAYLDLFGNVHLSFDSVYIDRAVIERPKSETRALRSLFTPKAAAILRVMLLEPSHAWRVAPLAERAKASLGHVSNVRRALLDREWSEKKEQGVVLTQPSQLLKTWRANYRRPCGERIRGYTYLHGKELAERLSATLNARQRRPRVMYSKNSAAQWIAPYARDGTYSFYADKAGTELLQEVLKLVPVGRGANIVVKTLIDETLFDDAIEPRQSVFCTSPIVTYLDLWNGNDRDRETAHFLAEECFQWLS